MTIASPLLCGTLNIPAFSQDPLIDGASKDSSLIENTPTGWLARARKIHDQNDSYLGNRIEGLSSPTSAQAKKTSRYLKQVDAKIRAKLISLGHASIEPCIDQIFSDFSTTRISEEVLSDLGTQSIAPLLARYSIKHSHFPEICKIVRAMQINPGNYLAELACTPGRDRANAIKILASIKKRSYIYVGDHTPIEEFGAISHRYQTILLKELQCEKIPQVKSDLLLIQRYFDSPGKEIPQEIISALEINNDASVRATAASVIGDWVVNASPQSALPCLKALSSALSTETPESVKIACAEALYRVSSNVDETTIEALRGASQSQNSSLRQAATIALAHMAISNKSCLPDLVQALGSSSSDVRVNAKSDYEHLKQEEK